MLNLKKLGYYNIFLMLIAVSALVLSIIALTRRGESFGNTPALCSCSTEGETKCDTGYECNCPSQDYRGYGKCEKKNTVENFPIGAV